MIKILFSALFILATSLSSYCQAGQVNAFIYHRFDEARYPSTNISAYIFKQQLDYLKQQNLEVISLGETATRLAGGEDLPAHAVALCVDDSFRSFYDVAMPIIRQYGFPVTLFVNTDAVGTSGYLNWDELRELAAEGVEIGNHTATHDYLVELQPGETHLQWKLRIQADIRRAQSEFDKHLGFQPILFAYPFGEYSEELVDIIEKLGFIAAFAQQSGVISQLSHHYILPRFPMGGPFATFNGFKDKLSMQPLPVTEEYPLESVLERNPPVLMLKVSGATIDPRRFNCFVQGDNSCRVDVDEEKGSGWYQVVAKQPLTGRRNKYTVTVQTKEGGWLWYSHPWVKADRPALQ